jgi:hypothetical protein
MADDLNSIELEVERELGRWAGRLDVRPTSQVVASLRVAVRHEVNEAWLHEQSSPTPKPAVVERVRLAVLGELGRGFRAGRLHRWVSSQAWVALGAAAMLLIVIGAIRYAGTLGRPAAAPDAGMLSGPAAAPDVGMLMAALPDSPNEVILRRIGQELQSIEADLDVPEAFPEDRESGLGDLVEELDRLLDEPEPAKRTSDTGLRSVGVMG